MSYDKIIELEVIVPLIELEVNIPKIILEVITDDI